MNLFIQNKYTKWYDNIIKKSMLCETLNGYTEKHHIIPKSLDGGNEKSNIAVLTAREHFVCHILLTKMTEGKNKAKMIYAAMMMSLMENKNQKRYINARLYETVRKEHSKMIKGKNSPSYGKKHSEESNRARSEKLKGRKLPPQSVRHRLNISIAKSNPSDETRLKMSNAAKNRIHGPHSEETKIKIGLAHKGRPHEVGKCFVCSKEMNIPNLTRWHNENCKHKKISL